MKKFALLIIAAVLFTACSEESPEEDQIQKDTMPLVEVNLSKMLPAAEFDSDLRGTYAGVIVSQDTKFHGRLWLNIANDGNFGAQIQTINGDKLYLGLSDTDASGTVYTFSSKRVNFTVDLSDYDNVIFDQVTVEGKTAFAHVRKEHDSAKGGIVLGTFDGSLVPDSNTGTWDFMADPVTGFITDVIVTASGGSMNVDVAADMETGDIGCGRGVTAPAFFEDVTTGPGEFFEIASVGQFWNLPNGTTVVYDYTFSKAINDINMLMYNQGVGFMPIFNNLLFGGTLNGCNSFDAHGYWVLTDMPDGGGVITKGGRITFDTTFLPPPPPPTSIDGTETVPTYTPAPKPRLTSDRL